MAVSAELVGVALQVGARVFDTNTFDTLLAQGTTVGITVFRITFSVATELVCGTLHIVTAIGAFVVFADQTLRALNPLARCHRDAGPVHTALSTWTLTATAGPSTGS